MSTTPQQHVIPDDLIEMKAAARLAKCHVATLFRYILGTNARPSRLRAWKRGGRYLVSRAEVLGLFVPVQKPAAESAPTAQTEAEWERVKRETLKRAGLA